MQRQNEQQLEALVEETSALSAVLKRRIKALERQAGSGRDGQIRKQQTGLVKSKFLEAIQSYQEVERQYRQKYKQRMERQFRIVKPDATPDEVKAVVNDDSGANQIFQQAVSRRFSVYSLQTRLSQHCGTILTHVNIGPINLCHS